MGRRSAFLRRIRNIFLCLSCKVVTDTVEELPSDFNEPMSVCAPTVPRPQEVKEEDIENYFTMPGAVPESVENLTDIEVMKYYQLLEEDTIKAMLKADKDHLISNKYHLSTVLVYFKRAGLALNEFTRMNFFLALCLILDIEQDSNVPKYLIILLALGENWKEKVHDFLRLRDDLFRKLQDGALVTKVTCEEVMFQHPLLHSAWCRERSTEDINKIFWTDFLPWF